MDNPELSAEQISAIREARSIVRKRRKQRGRGRAFFSKVHDIGQWTTLTKEEQQLWINAVDQAQLFEHDENPLAIAAMLGQLLHFYDMSKARSHVAPELGFLELSSEKQKMLFRLAMSLHEPLVVDASPSIVATIELFEPMDNDEYQEFFETLADHLGELEEKNPGKNWELMLSATNYSSFQNRWKRRFRRWHNSFSHNPEVL